MANRDQMIAASTVGEWIAASTVGEWTAASTVGEWIQWGLQLHAGGTELFFL
jgi:hypothetical protein